MDYNNAIKDITSESKFHIDLGLDRISELLDKLGNPQEKIKCIQVAGTNGKGSVCTMLSSVLKEAGYKTGLYTSPHIFDYTERIKIDGVSISENDFSDYYQIVTDIAESNNIYPTEFEILTAIMFKYFADNNIDIAVVETGLGGRFDATNVIKTNLCSIITHIDLDHTDILGDTKEKIAFEKAGIIKPESIVITSECYECIKDRADELNTLLVLSSPFVSNEFIDALSLKGIQQQENLALVLSAIETVFPNITKETIINGLKQVKNPCRFQYIEDMNLIIDGAHNPSCFEALRENLDRYFPDTKRNYVFGCLNTKDYRKMLSYIETDKNLNKLYIYHFNNQKAVDFETLKSKISIPCERFTNLENILDKCYLTVICGSFYMINEIIEKDIIF